MPINELNVTEVMGFFFFSMSIFTAYLSVMAN